MRLTTAFLCAFALFGQSDEVRSPKMTAEDVAAGAKTFRSHCAECHGLNAEGGRGPGLAEGNYHHGSSDAALLHNISNGIAGTEMPGLFYSSDRIWQVIAYLRSLNKSAQSAVRGDVKAGKALFESTGCADCHRIDGEGGRMGPDLTAIGRSRAPHHLRSALTDPGADVRQRYWVVDATTDAGKSISGFLMNEDTYSVQFIDFGGQLHSYAKSGLRKFKVEKISKMPSYKDRFSAKQLDDLVSYLSSLRPGKGDER